MRTRYERLISVGAWLLLMLPSAAGAQDASDLAKADPEPRGKPDQRAVSGQLGRRHRRQRRHQHAAQLPAGHPICRQQQHECDPPGHHALTSQPGSEGVRSNGMADITASAFFSPIKTGRIIWGMGPVVLLPTATDNALGTQKFGVGPTAVVLTQPGKWTLGTLFNHIWSTSGATDRDDVNSTYLQPCVNYNLGSGLAVGVGMEATGNWEADEHWTAPLLFQVSKVTLLGKRPVNLAVAAGPMATSPAGGADWRFRLVATFLYPR
jgi:hypothetical protein